MEISLYLNVQDGSVGEIRSSTQRSSAADGNSVFDLIVG